MCFNVAFDENNVLFTAYCMDIVQEDCGRFLGQSFNVAFDENCVHFYST